MRISKFTEHLLFLFFLGFLILINHGVELKTVEIIKKASKNFKFLKCNDYMIYIDTNNEKIIDKYNNETKYSNIDGEIGDIIKLNKQNNNCFLLRVSKRSNFCYIYEISGILSPTRSYELKDHINFTDDHIENLNKINDGIVNKPEDTESFKNLFYLLKNQLIFYNFSVTQTHIIGYENNWNREVIILRVNIESLWNIFFKDTLVPNTTLLFRYDNFLLSYNLFVNDDLSFGYFLVDPKKFSQKISFFNNFVQDSDSIKMSETLKNQIAISNSVLKKIDGKAPDKILDEWKNLLSQSSHSNTKIVDND